MYRNKILTSVSRLCALVLVILISPLFIFIFLLLLLHLREYPLFLQKRLGLNGRIFLLVKFKTMVTQFDAHGVLLPDKKRTTRFGNFLRSTSLDEIPSLINIILGDMVFVGPRPLPSFYASRYSRRQWSRHEVYPGITGLAQVRGRNSINWNRKFALDLAYIEHQSFCLNLKILYHTACVVLRRSGVNADGGGSMPPFRGNNR